MSQQEIVDWLEYNQITILRSFIDAAQDSQSFPNYASLKPPQIRAVMKRELRGLISYLAGDEAELGDTKKTHKEQAVSVTVSIPVEEQMKFLEKRLEILHSLFAQDTTTQHLQTDFQLYLDDAVRFYRINTRKIEFDRQLGTLID